MSFESRSIDRRGTSNPSKLSAHDSVQMGPERPAAIRRRPIASEGCQRRAAPAAGPGAARSDPKQLRRTALPINPAIGTLERLHPLPPLAIAALAVSENDISATSEGELPQRRRQVRAAAPYRDEGAHLSTE